MFATDRREATDPSETVGMSLLLMGLMVTVRKELRLHRIRALMF